MDRDKVFFALQNSKRVSGAFFHDYQLGIRHLSTFIESLVAKMMGNNLSVIRINELERFYVVCNELMGQIFGRSLDGVRRSLASRPLLTTLQNSDFGRMAFYECAAILKVLSGKPGDAKVFEVNESGTNLQWHLINSGFGNLIVSEPRVLNGDFVGLVQWIGDRVEEIADETRILLVCVQENGIGLIDKASALMARSNDLNQKLLDLFRLFDFMTSEPIIEKKTLGDSFCYDH